MAGTAVSDKPAACGLSSTPPGSSGWAPTISPAHFDRVLDLGEMAQPGRNGRAQRQRRAAANWWESLQARFLGATFCDRIERQATRTLTLTRGEAAEMGLLASGDVGRLEPVLGRLSGASLGTGMATLRILGDQVRTPPAQRALRELADNTQQPVGYTRAARCLLRLTDSERRLSTPFVRAALNCP